MTIKAAAASITLMLLTACKSDVQVQGDVFVATRGGQAFKLALVSVDAFSESDIRKTMTVRAQRVRAALSR